MLRLKRKRLSHSSAARSAMEDTQAFKGANRGALILTVIWVECAIACIFVAARVYARTRLIHNMGIDDWMILWALVNS